MDKENKSSCESGMRRRVGILAVFFAGWLLLALGRAWYIAVPARSGYIAAGEKMSRRDVTIPASRGRIMDADGVALAWSEHLYDLKSTVRTLSDEETAALKKIIPDLKTDGEYLRRNLTPGEVMSLEELIRSGVRVWIVVHNERIVIDSPEVRRLVGEVSNESGSVRGISGWEKEFDRELSGSPGRVNVMFDRNRNWIHSTVKVLEPMVEGRDVKIDRTLRELEKRGGEAADGAK